jgi:21S rRNA (uridine2791-2'-O)-methyltransferase
MAALTFGFDTLRTGGHFVCKFYQGAEEKALEKRLKRLFAKVHREKPESSRSVSNALGRVWVRVVLITEQESKEAYFVALRRNETPKREEVFLD